uniref:Invertebrate Y-linked doublesex- and mab-3-related transcription factor n=1 Tax=Panulirus ornatus TaxID=150431 RepID=A0AAU6PDA3_9EUCA
MMNDDLTPGTRPAKPSKDKVDPSLSSSGSCMINDSGECVAYVYQDYELCVADDAGQEGERNNKRQQHCTTCKNHGQNLRKSNHKCQYEACECLLCQLTRLSRLVMRHQQRLWRHLKDAKGRGDAIAEQSLADTKLQKCDMCRNHGVMKEKRAHKNTCPYQDCPCDLCNLTRKRRDIMRHQQRVRRSQVTSRQHDEAYDYVIKTTAELAQMSMGTTPAFNAPTPTSSFSRETATTDTTTTTNTTTTNTTTTITTATTTTITTATTITTTTTNSTCNSASVPTECTSQTLASNTAMSVAPLKEPPPLVGNGLQF